MIRQIKSTFYSLSLERLESRDLMAALAPELIDIAQVNATEIISVIEQDYARPTTASAFDANDISEVLRDKASPNTWKMIEDRGGEVTYWPLALGKVYPYGSYQFTQ